MSNRKSFKDWFQEDIQRDQKFKKSDGKRYDRKKAAIQKARRQKTKQKNSYFS